MNSPCQLTLLALLAAFSAGCSNYHNPAFNGDLGANESVVLIVPFQESKRLLWYGESARGKQLATSLKAWARGNADAAYFTQGPRTAKAIEKVRDWLGEEDTSGDWPRLAVEDWRSLMKGLEIKYLVEGDIGKARLRNPNVIGIYDGEVRANYRIIDLESGTVAYSAETVAKYQNEHGSMVLDRPSGETDEAISKRLMDVLAEEIGKELYGYYPEHG